MDATAWLDRWWDDRVALVRYPSRVSSGSNPYQQPGVHLVRETATHAAALLARDQPGDRDRAARGLAAVLAHQIDAPGAVTHGTWRRSPREPVPGPQPREWIDYDPNYREFVGCALALALERDAALPPELVASIEGALRRAAVGTVERAVPAEYTNIALLSAFLLDIAGDRLGEGAWRRRAEALADEVARAYEATGALPEHNSPTYYGIDLYGLALWRARAPSARLRQHGAALEARLWRDLVRFYHPGLRNLCGPYSRAYGMDMTGYVAALGCWIARAPIDPADAPLPSLGDAVPHAHDFFELPLVDLLGSQPPADAAEALRVFKGPRAVEQAITEAPRRVATAHLRSRVMWGAEHASGTVVHWQQHPATLHWQRPCGRVGWLRLVTTAPVDAVAHEGGLDIAIRTDLRWLRDTPVPVWLEGPADLGLAEAAGKAGPWLLPGIALQVEAPPGFWGQSAPTSAGDATRVGATVAPRDGRGAVDLRISILDAPD